MYRAQPPIGSNYFGKTDIEDQLANLNWENKDAVSYINAVRRELNLPLPTCVNPHQHGFVLWDQYNVSSPLFFQLKLTDTRVHIPLYDLRGTNSTGLWEVSVKFHLIKQCLASVLGLTDALSYDQLHRTLTAKGPDHQFCISLLMLATSLGNCFINKDTVEKKKLVIKVVEESIPQAKKFEEQLMINLTESLGTPIVAERF